MRTVAEGEAVRLYHLDPASGVIATLLYGTLAEAMRAGAAQDASIRADLYIQTRDDVVAFDDLAEG